MLRRPPLGHVLPTAHDMVREHRVLQALEGTAVPVPRVLHLGGADGPLGVDFYVMERVVGHVCRNALPPGYADDPEPRAAIGAALVDVLADLHAVDPVAVGLEGFGRPAGFVERQLRRWSQQWEATKTGELPALDELRDELVAHAAAAARRGDRPRRLPARQHGPAPDVAGPHRRRPRLGDEHARRPADRPRHAARLLERGDRRRRARRGARDGTGHGGRRIPRRARRSIRRYAARTGFDVSDVEWYQAFAFFKLAVVCQGIAARAAGGAMLGSGFDEAQRLVAPLVAAGRRLLGLG